MTELKFSILLDIHNPLFLAHIEDDLNNSLLILVKEGIVSDNSENVQLTKTVSLKAREINHNDDSQYKIFFENYIAYSIKNESCSILDDSEKFRGKSFRIYSDSSFLEFVEKTTINVWDDNVVHYEIVCCDQIIDVISTKEPIVTIKNCT